MDVPDSLRNGPVLIALFGVLAVVSSAVAIVATGGSGSELAMGLGGGVGVAVVVVGSYALARRYDRPHSHAVAHAAVMFGVVLLAGVVAELLIASGQVATNMVFAGLGGAVVLTLVLLGVIRVFDQVATPG